MIRKFIDRFYVPILVVLFFGFLIAIVLRIFNRNIEHLENQIESKKTEKSSKP